MAHQIYGDNENIFGYKDLSINVYLSAGPLDVYYDVKYSQKVDDMPNNEGLKADNVSVITDFFSGAYYTNLNEFLEVAEKKSKNFEPVGDLLHEFTIDGRTFQINLCDSSTANFQKFHSKLEFFIFWYIDAASRIDHDEHWKFFVVYEKYSNEEGETRFATVGYASIYMYFHYPDKHRPRISQFLILPPFQRMGIGTRLLEQIYSHLQSNDKVCDITVEDAGEDFQRLRNTVDARLLKDLPSYSAENLKKGFNVDMAHDAKNKFKINPKQSRIICEILRLGVIDKTNIDEYKAYRLDVKKRLNMNYLKEKRDLKRVIDRGFKISAERKLMLPSSEDNMEQLDGMYKETEEYYLSVLERIWIISSLISTIMN